MQVGDGCTGFACRCGLHKVFGDVMFGLIHGTICRYVWTRRHEGEYPLTTKNASRWRINRIGFASMYIGLSIAPRSEWYQRHHYGGRYIAVWRTVIYH